MRTVKNKRTLLNISIEFIKSYRKNTFALLLSLTLSVSLIVSIFTLFHTNQEITEKQNLFIFTAYDYELNDVTASQLALLERESSIEHLGVSQYLENIETADNQQANLVSANPSEILAVSSLIDGRLPEKENEIVAEKWALLNLGINPIVDQSVSLPTIDMNTNKITNKKVTIVGILSNLALNKRAGAVTVYTFFDNANVDNHSLTTHIAFKPNINKNKKIAEISTALDIDMKKVRENVWRNQKDGLPLLDIELGTLLIFVCISVIYGIYRTALVVRKNQYGIYRALGVTQKQVRLLVFYELGILFLIALPLGIALGIGCANIVTYLSKDSSVDIYFWGKAEKFELIVPYIPMLICLILFGFFLFAMGFIISRMINKENIIQSIFNSNQRVDNKLSNKWNFKIKRIPASLELALKYIFKDFKSSLVIIASIVIGSCVFSGLLYQANLAKTSQQIRIDTDFYNSDFLMTTYDDRNPASGITEQTYKKIQGLDNISFIETQSALPIRVVDDGVQRNDSFFDQQNSNVENSYGFRLNGNDGSDEVYFSKLKGYNSSALDKLEDYRIEGITDFSNLKSNEIILAMPTTSKAGRSKGIVGFFKNGNSLMSYSINDEITMKYRSDLNTEDTNYWTLKDSDADYKTKKYKVVAITYYPYMPIVSQLEQVYPLLITSEDNYKKLVPHLTYETINITASAGTSKKTQEKIEHELINFAVQNQEVTARSMIDEKEQLYSMYSKEMVYVYGIAIVTLILIITNLFNNLKYRMESKKNELFIFKAIGMTFPSISNMILIENLILTVLSLGIALLISIPITLLLYRHEQMYLLGKVFQYPFVNFLIIAVIAILICFIISRYLAKRLNETDILNELNKVE